MSSEDLPLESPFGYGPVVAGRPPDDLKPYTFAVFYIPEHRQFVRGYCQSNYGRRSSIVDDRELGDGWLETDCGGFEYRSASAYAVELPSEAVLPRKEVWHSRLLRWLLR